LSRPAPSQSLSNHQDASSAYLHPRGTLLDTVSLHDALPIYRVASNIGISQSTFSVKLLNLFSRSRRKTNKRKSKHSAMLRNKETRHRMFIGLLNTTRKLA